MARPTLYNAKMLTKTKEYLAKCVDEIVEYHKTRGEKSDTYDRLVRVKLPTMEGLAVYLGVNRDTIFEWAKHHPAFSDSLETLKAIQAERLINNGLSGDYNPVIAKLILSSNHGMAEKQDMNVNHSFSLSQLRNGEGE